MQQLTKLELAGCEQITDAGFKELAKLQKLTKLNLTYTRNITDEGLYGTLI